MTDFDLTIIGGGVGGLNIASGAARLGARVALVEKYKLGGDCLYYGCVPTKALIRSAKIISYIRRASEYGLHETQVSFNFKDVMDHMREVVAKVSTHDDPKRFEHMGVKVLFAHGKFIDPYTLDLDGQRITSRQFVIATGSRTAAVPIKGIDKVDYLTSESALELNYLPKSIIIMGGGPIGLEFAQIYARFGSKVTVLEKTNQVLPREDKEVADILESILRDEGIEIHTGVEVDHVKQEGNQKVVMVKRNGLERLFQAEDFMIAVGRAPNIEGLNLEAAGVETQKNGVIVNRNMRTSARNIWACGDVTGKYLFTHVAEYQAGLIVFNAVVPILKRKADYRVVPWATFTDPELGRIGLTENEARQVYRDIKVYKYDMKDLDRAIVEGEEKGIIKIICTGRGTLLGAHVLAAQGGEIVHEFILAMKNTIGIGNMSDTIHIYPTLAQAVKRATDRYYAEKIFTGWVPRLAEKMIRWFG